MNVHKFIANLKRKSYYSNSWGIVKVVFSCGALWLMVYFIRGFFLCLKIISFIVFSLFYTITYDQSCEFVNKGSLNIGGAVPSGDQD